MCNLFEKFWNWLNDDEPSPTTKTPTYQTTRPNVNQPTRPNVSQPVKSAQTTQGATVTQKLSTRNTRFGDFILSTNPDDSYTIYEYKGSSPCVVIPNEYMGSPISHIGTSAFWECQSIKSLVVPPSIKTIGLNAFFCCENLKSITFEKNSNLTTIEWNAFAECGLTTITIPSSVTKIESEAFAYCDLDTVIFEDNGQKVTIGDEAFCGCEHLVGIALPRNVSLGENVFEDCNTICYAKIPSSAIDKIYSMHFLAIIDADLINHNRFAMDNGLTEIPISSNIKDIGLLFAFPNYPGRCFKGTIETWLQTCLPNYKDPLLFGPITNPLCSGARLYANYMLVKVFP